MSRIISILTVVLCAGLLVACESSQEASSQPESQPASMGMLNDSCPMSGEPASPDSTVTYMGHTVGLCCDGCKGGWSKMSDKQKADFIAKYDK
jgi:hypothetical protein